MQLTPAFVANILALSIAVLPVTTAAESVGEYFCDWETSPKLSSIRNGPIRRADNVNQGTDSDPSAIWADIFGPPDGDNEETDSDPSGSWADLFGPPDSDNGRALHVDLYLHVVGQPKGNASSEFLLDREALTRQVDVLNESFKPANISFTLSGIDWTNASLYLHGHSLESQLAMDLYKGNLSSLNVIFAEGGETHGGYTIINRAEKVDGCLVNSNTVPGGSHPAWNMGITTVHEVGHWFSLEHTELTNQGDCEHNWRNVTGLSNRRCGERCDWNYMSYGADECLLKFTRGQITQMRRYAINMRGL